MISMCLVYVTFLQTSFILVLLVLSSDPLGNQVSEKFLIF